MRRSKEELEGDGDGGRGGSEQGHTLLSSAPLRNSSEWSL